MMKKILFLCTGNSCRSQMAEGFGKAMLQGVADVTSGGIDPKGVHPLAVQYMQEVGIDISTQTSKAYKAQDLAAADLLITLCNSANTCIAKPEEYANKFLHWDLPDPAEAKEGEEELVFRSVRNQLKVLIHSLIGVL